MVGKLTEFTQAALEYIQRLTKEEKEKLIEDSKDLIEIFSKNDLSGAAMRAYGQTFSGKIIVENKEDLMRQLGSEYRINISVSPSRETLSITLPCAGESNDYGYAKAA